MGFSGTESSGALADNGLTPQRAASRAKQRRTLEALEEARRQLIGGSPKNCMNALHDAQNILSNDYEIDIWNP